MSDTENLVQAPTWRYLVTFERVGRNHHVPDLQFVATGGDVAAGEVHSYVGRHLGSREYSVDMYQNGTGSIDGGRFGTFTWTREEVQA